MKNFSTNLSIDEVTSSDIHNISETITEWQKTPSFNSFLREAPMSPEENRQFILHKLTSVESFARVARVSDRIVGLLFLHSFDEKNGSLEESIRVSPELRGCGIGTRLKRETFRDVLNTRGIDRIISWHSAWNHGTFFTNARCNGTILNFIENQTNLPNINKITDDFQWEITKVLEKGSIPTIPNISGENAENILFGLKKHDFLK